MDDEEKIRAIIRKYGEFEGYDITEAKLKEQDGYTISFSFDQSVMVEADAYKIFQVIYNLVNNAINYTGADKTI